METLFWHLHIYRLLVAQYMKKRMQYRVDYVVNILGGIIDSLAKLFTIWLIFQSIPNLQGWNFYELLFFLGFFQAAMLPYGMIFPAFWELSGDIWSGNFINYYFRPLNMMFYYASKQFGLQGPLISFSIAIVMLAYAGAHLAIHWTVWTLLLLILNWFSSSLIIASILIGGMTMSFWIINAGWCCPPYGTIPNILSPFSTRPSRSYLRLSSPSGSSPIIPVFRCCVPRRKSLSPPGFRPWLVSLFFISYINSGKKA